MTAPDPTSLFRRVDGWYEPTVLTTGPWRPDAMHGGPPAALCGLAIDAALDDGEVPARIVIDLEAPVPLEPLRVDIERTQTSRRVGRLDFVLSTRTRRVSSGNALVLRSEPLPEPVWRAPVRDLTVPGPAARHEWGDSHLSNTGPVFHRDASEHRTVGPAYGESGPGASWVRLMYPLVEDEVTPPIAAMLAAADFGSALAHSLPRDSGLGLINVDVAVALVRPPVGEWFLIESEPLVDRGGVGLASAQLCDETGPLGLLHLSQIGHSFG